jgi:SpoVK/Ycf46/Vps4 family AAA+-type ATPase
MKTTSDHNMPKNYIRINLKGTNEIVEALITYIKKHGSYSISDNYDVDMKDMINKEITMNYSNLAFDIDENIRCRVETDLNMTSKNNKLIQNRKSLQTSQQKNGSKFLKSFNNDLLSALLIGIRYEIYKQEPNFDVTAWLTNCGSIFFKDIELDTNDIIYWMILAFLEYHGVIINFVSNLDGNKFHFKSIKFIHGSQYETASQNTLFVTPKKFAIDNILRAKYDNVYIFITSTFDNNVVFNTIVRDTYKQFNDKNKATPSAVSMSNDIILYVISKNYMKSDALYDIYTKFIETKILIPVEYIDVKIFEIKNVRTEKITQIDNPEYEKYIEQRKLIQELQSTNKDANYDISKLQVHSKQIQKIDIVNEIKCNEVTNCVKDINTLYLREDDKQMLVNVLDQFRNNKEMYTRLGIPGKLRFLLYGKPGTGKTTTIKAIATYLKKNIYYVNLNNVSSNSQLKMMFDQVILGSANGGIIVFEDIDCMTNIVASRDGIDQCTNLIDTLSQSDDKLSLSYFLNLLDGSLTCNESVFIITTNHLEKLDKAIYRSGRIDVLLDFKLCDHYQINEIFKSFIGRELNNNVLAKIQIDKFTPSDIIFELIRNIYKKDKPDEILMSRFL